MARLSTLLITTALIAALASPASACGESLFRVGKGVRYRQYIAPLPGNILLVARSENDRRVAEWLSNAGHNVQVVEDPVRLQSYLSKGKFDIVMAYFKDGDAVEAEKSKAHSNAKYLPVVMTESGKVDEVKSHYRQSLTENDFTPKTLLKTIHRTLKSDSNNVGVVGASD